MSEETQRVVKTPKKTRENQNFEKFQAREKRVKNTSESRSLLEWNKICSD